VKYRLDEVVGFPEAAMLSAPLANSPGDSGTSWSDPGSKPLALVRAIAPGEPFLA
jgi:hypothetical protein